MLASLSRTRLSPVYVGAKAPLTTYERDNPRMPTRVAIDRMVVIPHRIEVPVDWNEPSGPKISVFAREVVAAEHAADAKRPAIVWFQGGPGFEFAHPDQRGGWLEQLLTRYRVVLLDQRGTGLSTPLEARALPFAKPEALAEYLSNFRADSIVRDADRMRSTLYGEDANWYVFGQSFGGFCSLTYLSLLPEHITGVIITGGFAPVLHETEEICARLTNHVASRNADFFARYPDDAARVRRIVDHLEFEQRGRRPWAAAQRPPVPRARGEARAPARRRGTARNRRAS